jgi:hypothetical protein
LKQKTNRNLSELKFAAPDRNQKENFLQTMNWEEVHRLTKQMPNCHLNSKTKLEIGTRQAIRLREKEGRVPAQEQARDKPLPRSLDRRSRAMRSERNDYDRIAFSGAMREIRLFLFA